MLGLYVDYSISALEHIGTLWMDICLGGYASNLKCILYTRVPVHIVDCTGLICGIYTDMTPLHLL